MTIDDLIRELGLPDGVLRSDKHDLDREFERHPEHVAIVADALAEARRDRDRAKSDCAMTEARVRREQTDHVPMSGKKPTVADIAAQVAADPEVRKAERVVFNHDMRVEKLAGLLGALQAKTSALKHLSELYQAGYYVTKSAREVEPRARRRE